MHTEMMSKGCGKSKCPCRAWVQCPAYVDLQEQARRIAEKDYDFMAWYDAHFRIEYNMDNAGMNG